MDNPEVSWFCVRGLCLSAMMDRCGSGTSGAETPFFIILFLDFSFDISVDFCIRYTPIFALHEETQPILEFFVQLSTKMSVPTVQDG